MDIIEKTRELGKMIQADERYIAYQNAKTANDNDEELQKLISEFNLKRISLNTEMSKEDKDEAKMKEIDNEIKELYHTIMTNDNMNAFNDAKSEMDNVLSQINMIITATANGEDPETCATEEQGCSGSCGSCGGCH